MTDQPEICGAQWLAEGNLTRPRVTLALFAYNQQSYVRAAVEAALAQDYDGPLEIILSDDGSHDETFAVMQQVARAYTGPHHVRLNRNDPNLGLSAHVNRVLSMAQGEIVVMAAGDDVSLPDRVRESVAALARHPGAMAVSFSDIRIDDSGARLEQITPSDQERIIDLKTFLAAGPRAQSRLGLSGASRAFRREAYDRFGDLLPDCPAEDTPYLLRTLYLGTLVVCGWGGILYRVHEEQMSSSKGRARQSSIGYFNQFIKDYRGLNEIQPADDKIKREAYKFFRNFRVDRELIELSENRSHLGIRFLKGFLFSDIYSVREKIGMIKRFVFQMKMAPFRGD